MSSTERAAEFVYNGARLVNIATDAPINPVPWEDREEAFKTQFLKVIEVQMGPNRSRDAAQLHDSWWRAYAEMGWNYGEKHDPVAKTHPDMIPYDELGEKEQAKDGQFIDLCEIARQWIYVQC